MKLMVTEYGLWLIIPLLIISMIGLLLGMGGVYLVKRFKQERMRQAQAIFKVSATIISKRLEKNIKLKNKGKKDSEDDQREFQEPVTFFVDFQVSTGKQMTFVVPISEYTILQEGDCGTLTYQNKNYKSFKRNLDVIE